MPYLFISPFILVFVAFSLYPVLYALRLSFTKWRGFGTPEWIGLENYFYLLSNEAFWSSLENSAVLWALIVPIQLLVGFTAAILLNRTVLRFRSAYRVVFLIPFVVPLVAIAQIWTVVFDQRFGVVNQLLGMIGIPDIGWLTTSAWAKPTLALLFLWKTTGFAVIIILSGLQSIDSAVYEAAALDGASRIRQHLSMTIPLMRRTLAFLLILQTLAVFQMFAEPFVVTDGGPYGSTTTAGLYLFRFISVSDLGTGAASSFLLVIAVMAISLAFVRLLQPRD